MRVFIVEDDQNVLSELKELLERTFPLAEVSTAMSVQEAREMLDTMVREGRDLDAAVLDARLPLRTGEDDEINLLIGDVQYVFPDAFIVLCTAFPGPATEILGKETVEKKLAIDPEKFEMVVKTETRITPTAGKKLTDFLREAPLRRKLRDMFGDPDDGREGRYRRARSQVRSGARCMTRQLNALLSEVLNEYGKLSDEMRAEIARYFKVEERDGRYIIASLVPEKEFQVEKIGEE